jgi:hypothetical protein
MNTVIISHHVRALYNKHWLRKVKIMFRYDLCLHVRPVTLLAAECIAYSLNEGHYGHTLHHVILTN